MAGKVLWSTPLKTSIAKTLNKLWKNEMSALEQYIRSGGADAVWKKVAESVLRDAKVPGFINIIKESKPLQKGWEKLLPLKGGDILKNTTKQLPK